VGIENEEYIERMKNYFPLRIPKDSLKTMRKADWSSEK
jgi:hypothetical protein